MVLGVPAPVAGGLVLRRTDPLNYETSIVDLMGGEVIPNAHFYVRNHFPVPPIDASRWRLEVRGLVRRQLSLSLRDLLNLPTQAQTVTLECAGNGRSTLLPTVEGEQWGLGAVSTAEWTGVPLADVLDRAGADRAAREIVFRGADGANSKRFERSLTLEEVRISQALLAYAMNGEPLPPEHGFPLRVIVPGWYGVAAVKWLTEIELIDGPFTGLFQTEKYVYERERGGLLTREPVRQQRVRALITQPAGDSEVELGELAVRGLAWSGVAPIARVDVSMGGGPWRPARLLGHPQWSSWQRWELVVRISRLGRTVIRARATDRTGRSQPEEPEWNRLGYGNNAIQEVWIRATQPPARAAYSVSSLTEASRSRSSASGRCAPNRTRRL